MKLAIVAITLLFAISSLALAQEESASAAPERAGEERASLDFPAASRDPTA